MISNSQYHLRTHVLCSRRNHFTGILDNYNIPCNFELYLYLRRCNDYFVFRCCIPLFIKHYEIIVFYAESTSCKIFNKIALITIPIQNEKRFMDYFWKNISKEIFLKLFEK